MYVCNFRKGIQAVLVYVCMYYMYELCMYVCMNVCVELMIADFFYEQLPLHTYCHTTTKLNHILIHEQPKSWRTLFFEPAIHHAGPADGIVPVQSHSDPDDHLGEAQPAALIIARQCLL